MTVPVGSESGEAVIRYLLANSSAVLAIVPASRIYVGELPLGTAMPAIEINQISSGQRNTISNDRTPKQNTDRVQVTVYRGATPGDSGHPGLKPLLTLILSACQGQHGTINGIVVDSITPDVEGPNLPIPDLSIFTRSRDFIVKFIA